MSDDIVAELDCWLTHVGNPETTNDARFPIAAVQRARDEIVALHEYRDEVRKLIPQWAQEKRDARDEALEEAAQLVKRYCDSPTVVAVAGKHAAAAIRALKNIR